ncbi:PQQ-binding-like beta-propeller repeat protein [Micromonospora sp. NPDC048930]|uniref:outer membrane protein assembly factor BamB family protein n=1 Tax=Micromonospora sp. NPDC048930 TaxID=3364261 RepID=UPI003720E0D7
MTIIDLGELRDHVTPDPPTRRRPAGGRPYRFLAALAVALLTLAGGVPAVARAPATVPGGPAAAAFVAGGRLYVVQSRDPARGVGRQLVAYGVDPGPPQLLWRTLLPTDGVAVAVWEQGGMVLVVGRTANDTGWETLGVAAGTGRIGWREAGVAYPAGDAVVLQPVEGRGGEPTRTVEVTTGRTLWSVPRPPDDLLFSFGPAGVDRMVFVPASGAVEVYDPGTGARVAARDLRPGELPARPRILLAAGLLLVARDAAGTVTAYDLATLDQRWTISIPLVGYAASCGQLICASRQTGGMWALDPATGRIRWSDDRWAAALAATDGRLLVAAETAAGTRLTVLEEATGRVVADLGGWNLVPQDEVDGRVIGVRAGDDGRLRVAELDPALGGARIRDALTGATGDCRVGGAVLVCRRGDGAFGVWRIG